MGGRSLSTTCLQRLAGLVIRAVLLLLLTIIFTLSQLPITLSPAAYSLCLSLPSFPPSFVFYFYSLFYLLSAKQKIKKHRVVRSWLSIPIRYNGLDLSHSLSLSLPVACFTEMGKSLKKRQKWRNLEISPAPRTQSQQKDEEEETTTHPFLKIISKNMDVVISHDPAKPPVSTPADPPAVRLLYRSDKVPVFDPANCTVVGAGSGAAPLDPANTALFVGNPLRYAHSSRAGGGLPNPYLVHPPPPSPLSAYKKPEAAGFEQASSSTSSSK